MSLDLPLPTDHLGVGSKMGIGRNSASVNKFCEFSLATLYCHSDRSSS